MGLSHSPNIIKDGLVLLMDGANVRSFRGEPTTNLLPNPTVNAYPTVGNGWGTYNTNQYGSGNFFSIGTVSSVSNNIVTMTSAHSLRSYDVMRPQTTGGGVTANVDYLIKKISSTQFSLHEYNSSQDGTQGYINLTTGNHKVYDAFMNDTRISINSTNFPTMWWGAPHLPNSGLVKELRTNGFTHPDTRVVTDSIRLHYIRTDDVKDGMAYNVDASMTPNSPVTVSFYTKASVSAAVGKTIQYYIYNYGATAPNAYAMNFTLGQVGVWERQVLTYTPVNANMISYWFPQSGGVYSWEWSNMQVEQRSSTTAFVAGTRGTTNATGGGWVDLSGNGKHGELVNGPTYNSDNGGSIVFDGSNDYIDIASNLGTLSNYTIIFWARRDAENRMPISTRTGGALFYWYGDNSWYYTHGGVAGEYYYSKPTSIPLNTWGQYCVVYDGANVKIYRQGVYQGQQASSGTASFTQGLKIGDYTGGGYPYQGRISSVLMYNKALTETEVQQNFNATRDRYGV